MGAAGGVGGYAVQMAVARGARVIATVRGDADASEAHRLGAEDVYDVDAVDAVHALRESRPDGVDAVLDIVNGPPRSSETRSSSSAAAGSSPPRSPQTWTGSPNARSRHTTSSGTRRPSAVRLTHGNRRKDSTRSPGCWPREQSRRASAQRYNSAMRQPCSRRSAPADYAAKQSSDCIDSIVTSRSR